MYIPSHIDLEKIFCTIDFFHIFSTLFLIQLEATPLLNTESFGKVEKNPRIEERSMKLGKRDLQTAGNKQPEERKKQALSSVQVREKERRVGDDTNSDKPSFLG